MNLSLTKSARTSPPSNLKRDASKGTFNGRHDDSLYHLGFYFGMLHGSILDPHSGQLRPDVVALVTFTHPNTTCGAEHRAIPVVE